MTEPRTRAERSDYAETSRHADVVAFIDALRARGDPRLHVGDFGESPERRSLPLLVLSAQRHFTPEAARASGLPVVLVMCGIHAGEVEGKEAGLMLARDLLDGAYGDWLEHLVLLLVPLFNPDGNDRIDPENRRLDVAHFRGQLGPESGVGTRVNAAGINLNRDYMRQEAPEMRLLQSRVAQPWNPHLTIDCHATNGSIHRYALTYDVPHVVASGRREPIDYMKQRLLPELTARVRETEGLETFWYGNFVRDEGGEGLGWITYTHHPRFGGNYRGLTNRLDLLLEAYSYIPFRERVRVTYACLREALRHVAANGAAIVAMLEDCALPPDEIAVRYRLEPEPGPGVDVLTREPYTLEGAPIAVRVPYYGRFVAEHRVRRPWGYLVSPDVAAHLEAHGLRIEGVPSGPLQVEVPVVQRECASTGREILEANASRWLEAELRRERIAAPSGWRLVRTDQPRGAIAVYLCEAGSDDGLLAVGLASSAAGQRFPAWRVVEPPPGTG